MKGLHAATLRFLLSLKCSISTLSEAAPNTQSLGTMSVSRTDGEREGLAPSIKPIYLIGACGVETTTAAAAE